MIEPTTVVRLNHPLFRNCGCLDLKRVPKYLRFVCAGLSSCSRSWDALDQLDDTPNRDEMIFVGKLANRGTVHLDRVVKGRRVGEWYGTATYDPVDQQPTEEIVRDNEKWRQWCMEQEGTADD